MNTIYIIYNKLVTMNNKQLILIIVAIIIGASIIGGCIYYGLTNQDTDNSTVVNQTNNTTNNTTVNSTKITEDSSSSDSSSSSSSSSRYVEDERGTYDTVTGKYINKQFEGSTKEEAEQYEEGMRQEYRNAYGKEPDW